ncbi:MAG: hypothetical protein E6G96_13535, partial [Alphaproteobacteria bacterium]
MSAARSSMPSPPPSHVARTSACEMRGSLMRQRMLLGLIGANIMGSLSPALFADAFAAAGIEGFYHLIDVDRLREKRLPKLLDAIKAAGFAGANIT